jgi:dTDP-glucose 4,6-dehydratase
MIPSEVEGQTDEISNKDLILKILKLMGKGEDSIEYVKDRPGHDQKYAIDWSKLRRLGYQPSVDLDGGLKLTIDWYRQNLKWATKMREKGL